MKKLYLLFGILLCLTVFPAKATFAAMMSPTLYMSAPDVQSELSISKSIFDVVDTIVDQLDEMIEYITDEVNAKKATRVEATSMKTKDSTPFYKISDEEYQILYQIVEAEATDGTFEQKKNVASCIFARVESNDWPNTVKGVVFQKSQFSPISDGRYYSVKVTDDTKEAVNYIVQNGKEHSYIFFCSYGCKSSYFAKKDAKLAEKGQECYRDGIHRYYLN